MTMVTRSLSSIPGEDRGWASRSALQRYRMAGRSDDIVRSGVCEKHLIHNDKTEDCTGVRSDILRFPVRTNRRDHAQESYLRKSKLPEKQFNDENQSNTGKGGGREGNTRIRVG